MVTPQQEVGESVCCPAWTDTMAYNIINYSWHLSLPRGTEGVRDNARVHLRARALVSPWVRGGGAEGEGERVGGGCDSVSHPSNPRDCLVRKSLESHSRSSHPAVGAGRSLYSSSPN